jgi:hypothetical protein
VDESQLPSVARQGFIRPDTLLWSELLSDWTEAAVAKPNLFSNATSRQLTESVTLGERPAPVIQSPPPVWGEQPASVGVENRKNYRELGRILSKSSGWLRFVGVLNFIAFFFIVTIFIGIKCFGIALAAEEAARSGDYEKLKTAVTQTSSLFILHDALALFVIVIYFILFIGMALS